ncbi:arginine--tRNA ligase, partial [Flavobacteriaceae bacterium]|nr:arginine--tRNA ligase [Flavobacteriaceae bacterium]
MQSLAEQISESIHPFLKDEYNVEVPQFDFQATRKEFDGDITLVVFSLLKFIKTNPVQLSNQIGEFLKSHSVWVTDFNVVKGFLNLSIEDRFYVQAINQISNIQRYGHSVPDSNSITLVEYSSPNTNKPLHLGHIRNNLLGYSVAQILEASGRKVLKTQIINDRGIHICKSMVAWKRFSSGETPESSGIKGDKLVGNYYVRFDQEYKKEIETLVKDGMSEDQAKTSAPLFKEAQAMLRAWEAGNNEVVDLWQKMNNWVYDGFETTYTNLGVSFDSYYYESKTYLLGKELIDQGLKQSIFYQKEDGSIWVDLTEDG